jgi:hypothetical protein
MLRRSGREHWRVGNRGFGGTVKFRPKRQRRMVQPHHGAGERVEDAGLEIGVKISRKSLRKEATKWGSRGNRRRAHRTAIRKRVVKNTGTASWLRTFEEKASRQEGGGRKRVSKNTEAAQQSRAWGESIGSSSKRRFHARIEIRAPGSQREPWPWARQWPGINTYRAWGAQHSILQR